MKRCGTVRIGTVALWALVAIAPPVHAGRAKKAPQRIVHTPAREQAILTPLPIWVDSRDPSVVRVVAYYQVFGSKQWTAIDLTRSGNGWGGEIPCSEVGTVTGVLRYYVVAYDAQRNEIGWQASFKKPNKVKIRRTVKSPPHLPGQPPPARCSDPTDCPPGFPGCKGQTTSENRCTADDDCDDGMVCGSAEICEPPPDKHLKNWVSIGVLQDFAFFGNANSCTPEIQQRGDFSCLRQTDGAPYRGTPLADEPTSLRYGPGTTRLVLGYDRFVSERLTLGLRVGFVARGQAPSLENRSRSLPLLLKGRVAFWFATDGTVRPMAFVSGGYAPSDFKFHAGIEEDPTAPPSQAGNPDFQTVDVWTTFGPWSAGLGAGMMFATSTATGIILEVEASRTFPAPSTVVSPAVSFALGF